VLLLPANVRDLMIAHCLDWYPLEGCGLLVGPAPVTSVTDGAAGGVTSRGPARVTSAVPTDNEAASSRVYTVPSVAMFRAERDAQEHSEELVGVWHSHTHTDAYPSPTDIAQAPDPGWHYVIVSLRDVEPTLRSYRVVEGTVTEEQVEVQ
jgi:proteasome lid subunit RPN8/RPN11